MHTHILSVDIRLFADLWDDFGDAFCINMQNRNKSFISDVNFDTPSNYHLIGHHVPHFCTLLRNFCLTIDMMFMLHESIRHGLKAMLQRLLGHMATLALDPVDPATPLLLLFWAHSFQEHVSRFYDLVKVRKLRNPTEVVSYLDGFPANLPALTTAENTIRLLKHFPTGFPLGITTSQRASPAVIRPGPAHPPVAGPPGPKPPQKQGKQGVCVWFVCVQTPTDYCKRGEALCNRNQHRGPKSQAEKDQYLAWFAKNPKVTLQARYQ